MSIKVWDTTHNRICAEIRMHAKEVPLEALMLLAV